MTVFWSDEVFEELEREADRMTPKHALEWQRLILLLQQQPMMGVPSGSHPRCRRVIYRPLELVYVTDGRDVTVVAFADGRREPGYWRPRQVP